MRLLEFSKRFGDEESCKLYFKEFRENQGLICSKCEGKDFHWIPSYYRWQCKCCMKQITLRSGTLLEASKLPYHYWIYAIFFMVNTKKGISALEMQRQLGHKRYEPVWAMMHKIRNAMGNRDDQYKLDKIVEFDDAFVKASSDYKEDGTHGKRRGRGTLSKTPIAMMASTSKGSEKAQRKKNKKPTRLRFIKMKVIEDQTAKSFEDVVQENIDKTSTLLTDGLKAYSKLHEHVKKHLYGKIPAVEADKKLPWVHTAISNLKRELLGKYHNVKDDYLQSYLNEYCYKVNRRYLGEKLFERVMVAAVEQPWYGRKIAILT